MAKKTNTPAPSTLSTLGVSNAVAKALAVRRGPTRVIGASKSKAARNSRKCRGRVRW